MRISSGSVGLIRSRRTRFIGEFRGNERKRERERERERDQLLEIEEIENSCQWRKVCLLYLCRYT